MFSQQQECFLALQQFAGGSLGKRAARGAAEGAKSESNNNAPVMLPREAIRIICVRNK